MTLPVDEWDPELFTHLQSLLYRVSSPQTTRSTVQHLFKQLDKAIPWLLSLTQLPTPSSTDKQDAEKNPITTPSGTVYQITGDLLQAAGELSNFLSISHRFAANLIIRADQESHNYVARERGEIATYLLYAFLGQMLDFLHELIRLTIGPGHEEEEPFITLRGRVEDLLSRRVSVGSGEGTLVDLILNQLETLQKQLDELSKPQRLVGPAYELLTFRVRSIRSQQSKLASTLALIAQGGYLGRGHVVKLIKWLKRVERPDGVVLKLLAIFYVVSQPIDSISDTDPRLENVEDWCRDIKFLKIASNLIFVEQWACPKLREAARLSWALFIVSTLRHDPDAGVVGIDPHLADTYLFEAVNNDVFQFLHDSLTSMPNPDADEVGRLASAWSQDEFLLTQMQGVVELLASKKQFLRGLRNREEDNSSRRQVGVSPPYFSAFVRLASAIFERLPVDSAQYLWDDVTFTSALLDGRNSPSAAVWQLLAVISSGPVSAPKAFDRLSNTAASPYAALQFYNHYTSELPKLVENIKSTRERQGHRVRDEDVQLGIGLTRVLAAIVRSSSTVRTRLLQHKPNPIQLLFEMLNCDWDVSMKAAILDAITAFSSEVDDDTANRIVDNHDRISYPESTRSDPRSGRISDSHGWLKALETVEDGTFPLTRSYIRFLTALLPSTNTRVTIFLRRASEFVLRQLVSLTSKRFTVESERWEMLAEILQFVEKALIQLDMTDLINDPSNQAWKLFDLPGFIIFLRMLENDIKAFPLLSQVIDSIPSTPDSASSRDVRLRILRIFYRVLDVQLVFAEILLPALERPMPDKSAKPWPFRRPVNLEPLDLRLLNHLSNVTIIALWVNDDDLAVSYLSTKIISALAVSPHFNQSDRFAGDYHRTLNRLAGFIDASDESLRIAQGFCNKLDGEAIDITPDQLRDLEDQVLRGSDNVDLTGLPLAIRSTILDLLIDGTAPDAVGPNIAHFLLGFELKGHRFTLQNPDEADTRYSCLQVVLAQLREDLIVAHPVIAAKSVQLVHQLFAHPVTGRTTMSYATSIESFSAIQLRGLPAHCPESLPQGLATYNDIAVPTSSDMLVAYLNYQRWVISCVSLETHTFEGETASVETVAAELFGQAGEDERAPIIIQILNNIDVVWHEEAGDSQPLENYAQFNFDLFKAPNADYYDMDQLRKALATYRQQQTKLGKNAEAMQSEADYVLRRLSIRNHETEINTAKGNLLTAWAEALKVALGRLFTQRVSEDRQEAVLFELLDALLFRIGEDASAGVLDILAESVLVVMNTLRMVLAEYDGVNLPVDQLSNLLGQIINAVIRSGATENTRGNLYAALSQYFSLLSIPTALSDDGSMITATSGSLLQKESFAVLLDRKDRFFAILCKDAMDVRDVWKTECFALLGSIAAACTSERDRQILSPLKEYLPIFVRSLKDRELALQECLTPDADNLHAYWVFEAKIAFLLSVATTRKGAEYLLDAGVFEILSMCGFVAAEPYAEDSDNHMEAVSRQHRVLISVLQLISRILASLYKSPRSGAGHALGFFNAHRESIALILRETQQTPSPVGLDESRLVVAILSMIVHKIPENDKRNGQTFGALHLAILGLATRYFEPEWSDSPEEMATLEKTIIGLNQVILTYLCSFTTGLKAGSGYPVFLNGLPSGGSQRSTGAPSMRLAVQLLEKLVEEVQDLATEYDKLAERVQHDAELSKEELSRLERLDWVDQIISPESLRQAFGSRSHTLYIPTFVDMETFALLCKQLQSKPDPTAQPFSLIERILRPLRNVAAELAGVLQRLTGLKENEDLRRGGEQSEAYFGMLLRRLSELTSGLSEVEV